MAELINLISEHPIAFSMILVFVFISHYYTLYKILNRKKK